MEDGHVLLGEEGDEVVVAKDPNGEERVLNVMELVGFAHREW